MSEFIRRPLVDGAFSEEAWKSAIQRGRGPVSARRIGITVGQSIVEFRGEQPESLALPTDGALRGDIPLSITEGIEAK